MTTIIDRHAEEAVSHCARQCRATTTPLGSKLAAVVGADRVERNMSTGLSGWIKQSVDAGTLGVAELGYLSQLIGKMIELKEAEPAKGGA